jgi:hypothetical protein
MGNRVATDQRIFTIARSEIGNSTRTRQTFSCYFS